METISRPAAAPSSFRSHRKLAWLTLLVLIIAALGWVAVPVAVIMPFKAQTARGVAVSYALKSWAPVFTGLALIAALALIVWLWRGKRSWWRRGLLLLSLAPLLVAAWFARQNHFEWMFHPLANSAYVKASEASFVDDKDMVLAVEVNGEAAAYPVRTLTYHHIINDVVGGRPITATY